MAKINKLTNQELMIKLDQYIELYNRLENERQRRLEKYGQIDELLTAEEKSNIDDIPELEEFRPSLEKEPSQKEDSNLYRISFDEEELQKINATYNQEMSDSEKLQTITKILKLSDLNLDKD